MKREALRVEPISTFLDRWTEGPVVLVGHSMGGELAAALALLLARSATRPIGEIAATAETIRSGDLGQRIGYRGRDEMIHRDELAFTARDGEPAESVPGEQT